MRTDAVSPPWSSALSSRFTSARSSSGALAHTRAPSRPAVSMRARRSPRRDRQAPIARVTMGAIGCAAASMPSCSPCSIRDRLRRSSTSACRRSACARAMRRNRLPLEPRYRRRSSIVSTNPLMAVIGVRSSWETLATKSWRSRSNRWSRVASDAQISTSRPSSSAGIRLTRTWITASATRSAMSPVACSEVPARTGARSSRSDGAGSASARGRPTCSGRTPRRSPAAVLATQTTPRGSTATTASGSWASKRSTRRTSRVSATVVRASRPAWLAAVRARARHHASTPPEAPSSAIESLPAHRPRSSAGSSSAAAMPTAATAVPVTAAATGRP